MKLSINHQAFLELLKAGLWENGMVHDCPDGASLLTLDNAQTSSELCPLNRSLHGSEQVDWEKVFQLAEEQSVIGLVLAGIDWFKVHDSGFKIPQTMLLEWIGEVHMLEQQNKEMNMFIAELVKKMRTADIYTLLVKGQGIAQCYERPLWRSCGDVDLLLNTDNYEKAKTFLTPLAEHVEPENSAVKHLGMTIDQWTVELHGTMHTGISRRVDKGIDEVQDDCFCKGNVRSWDMNGTVVYLPSPDNDVILVFTHFLHHFFIEGVGLRQVCDWCRLLYTFKDSLNYGLLESRIKRMGLMSEWKAFASLAVEYLGMPVEAMPFHDVRGKKDDVRWRKKGERVLERILKSGNMGHNNDLSYRTKYSGLTYKLVALWRRLKDFVGFTKIFPLDAPRFFVYYVLAKMK